MTSCSICFEVLEEKDTCKTKCNHSFHTSCLLKWINSHSNCPMCRTELVEKKKEDNNIYRDPLDTLLDENPSRIISNAFQNYMG